MLQDKKLPWSTNQIQSTKPNIPRTTNLLMGKIGNSLNGGHNKTIAFKKVMAGELHKSYAINIQVKTLTPKTPPFQDLKMTIRSYFVPNSRVWKNAEKYTAQKGGSTEEKIERIPNLGGKILGDINVDTNYATNTFSTEIYKKMFMSSYVPRQYTLTIGEGRAENGDFEHNMQPISALLLRGRVAIYNDLERNKEFDEEVQEFDDDEVSQQEWEMYSKFDQNHKNSIKITRARKPDNYYTNIRTELQGFEENKPTTNDNQLLNWAQWESKIAEARSQAENAQKTDWEIISELRGSKKLTEGKVQLIGEKTFTLNYSSITQTSYNSNQNIQEQFQVMGTQGAYSYTNIKAELYGGMAFNEEGYVHIIATVFADTVYEFGIDRNEYNITPLSEYRPDLVNDTKDVLYAGEIEGTDQNTWSSPKGFKRKFSEYFKLPNVIGGDLNSINYLKIDKENPYQVTNTQIITNSTYQLYEQEASHYEWYQYTEDGEDTGEKFDINRWQDYTDLMINKNLAILQEIIQIDNEYNMVEIIGNDQIFFAGEVALLATLPIENEIAENYMTWGQH